MPNVSWYVLRNCWNIVNGIIKSLWLCQAWFDNCKDREAGENSLRLMQSSLSQKQQRAEVGSSLKWMVRDYLWDTTRIYTRTIVYRNIWLGNTYCNFCYSANMLNIMSHGCNRAQYYIAWYIKEYVNQI